jgi:hypothetical protein
MLVLVYVISMVSYEDKKPPHGRSVRPFMSSRTLIENDGVVTVPSHDIEGGSREDVDGWAKPGQITPP